MLEVLFDTILHQWKQWTSMTGQRFAVLYSIIHYINRCKSCSWTLKSVRMHQSPGVFQQGKTIKESWHFSRFPHCLKPLNVRQSNLKSKSINTLKSRILKWVCLVCLKIESTSHRWPFFLTNTRMNVHLRQRWAMFMPSKNSPCPGLVQGRQIARINYNKLVDCCPKMCVASAIWTYLEFIYAHRWS